MRFIHHNKMGFIENREQIGDPKPKLLLEVRGCIIRVEKGAVLVEVDSRYPEVCRRNF